MIYVYMVIIAALVLTVFGIFLSDANVKAERMIEDIKSEDKPFRQVSGL